MKFLRKLAGKDDETPKWDIRPPSERPVPRAKTELEEPPPVTNQKKEKNPFLDDQSLDTMKLEAEASPEDNPYQTHSWEIDPENDTRKLKTIQIGSKTDKPSESQFNPYDTGSLRRGWKK